MTFTFDLQIKVSSSLTQCGHFHQIWRNVPSVVLRPYVHKNGMTQKHNGGMKKFFKLFQKLWTTEVMNVQKMMLIGPLAWEINFGQAPRPLVMNTHTLPPRPTPGRDKKQRDHFFRHYICIIIHYISIIPCLSILLFCSVHKTSFACLSVPWGSS